MEGQKNKESQISNQNLTLLLTFSVVAAFSVLINLRVFYIVFVSSRRKSRYDPLNKYFFNRIQKQIIYLSYNLFHPKTCQYPSCSFVISRHRIYNCDLCIRTGKNECAKFGCAWNLQRFCIFEK